MQQIPNINVPMSEKVKLADLQFDKENPNVLDKNGMERLKTSIQKYGDIVPIITNKDLLVADGEQRATAMKELGMTECSVIRLPIEDVDRRLLRQVLNKLKGEHDLTADALEFEKIIEAGRTDDLKHLLDLSDNGLEKYLREIREVKPEDFEVPEIDKIVTDIKRGDIIELGNHRLICGDSTSEEDTVKLMNGDKAVLYLTDPPYGVSYSDIRKSTPIENDELHDKEFQSFLEKAFKTLEPHLKDNCAWYLWHAQKTQGYFTAAAAAAACSIIYHRQIVWVKPRLILGRGLYHWRHELCLMGWKKGNKPPFYGERNQTTVWEYPSPQKDTIHPTQKPLEVLLPAIYNHTAPNEIVVDNFGGSGSTLIACEQTGRTCYMMEIDPRYVEIICQRWERYTGGKREKLINLKHLEKKTQT